MAGNGNRIQSFGVGGFMPHVFEESVMSSKTVRKLLERDPEFVAKFLTGPSSALKEYGIDPETLPEKQVHALEAMVQQTQENIRTNAKLVGVEMAKSEWGIGMGCCNDVNTRFME
jgi:hypothetical protein